VDEKNVVVVKKVNARPEAISNFLRYLVGLLAVSNEVPALCVLAKLANELGNIALNAGKFETPLIDKAVNVRNIDNRPVGKPLLKQENRLGKRFGQNGGFQYLLTNIDLTSEKNGNRRIKGWLFDLTGLFGDLRDEKRDLPFTISNFPPLAGIVRTK